MSESFKDKTTNFMNSVKDKLNGNDSQVGIFSKIKQKFGKKEDHLAEDDLTEIDDDDATEADADDGNISEDDIGEDTSPFDLSNANIGGDDDDEDGTGEVNATELLKQQKDEEDEEEEDEEEEEEEEEDEEEGGSPLGKVKNWYGKQSKITQIAVCGMILYVISEFMFPKKSKEELKRIEKARAALVNEKKGGKKKGSKKKGGKKKQANVKPKAKRKPKPKQIEEPVAIKEPVYVPPEPKKELTYTPPEPTRPVTTYQVDNTNSDNSSKKAIEKIIDQQKTLVKREALNNQEYQPMPDFEIWGRGLVYNCRGKHWACVNREGFFQCKKNERWNSIKSENAECLPKEVYATFSDCRKVQLYNINQSVPTNFCKK